ncbi:hypothetical protein HOB10_04430 [Candidatus Parcubacteria bacterium]|jgi:hypothetical protein|nr:hypothetical protein [Candidatus Parcubacteria bacterium]
MKNSIKTLQLMLTANAVIWLSFGYTWLARVADDAQRYTIFGVMLINAIMMLVIAYLVQLKNKWVFYFAIAYVLTNIFLTTTDQFGVYDLIILVIQILILVYLINIKCQICKKHKKK